MGDRMRGDNLLTNMKTGSHVSSRGSEATEAISNPARLPRSFRSLAMTMARHLVRLH
jgi:hypothetical protein